MLTLTDFESRQPIAVRFFTQALRQKKLVNAYILKGQDRETMMAMILRLAQIINCQQSPGPAEACGVCQSCRWIGSNAHPGIITVSNLTGLQDVPSKGKTQKSISVAQLDALLKELALHSNGFHRIIVLTGAQELQSDALSETVSPPSVPPPKDWRPAEGCALQWLPLDRRIFPDVLANKFLKTLEEPPADALFFLLTDSTDKLLDTIVSRCQQVTFALPPGFYDLKLSAAQQSDLGALVQEIKQPDYVATTRLFQTYAQNYQLAPDRALLHLMQYIWSMRKHQPNQPAWHTTARLLESIDSARRMLQDKVREDAALEGLFLSLV